MRYWEAGAQHNYVFKQMDATFVPYQKTVDLLQSWQAVSVHSTFRQPLRN